MNTILPISGFPEWKPGLQTTQERFLDIIRKHFRLNGFSPIETPSVERVESLSAKGGGENEKEIYAIRRLHGESTDDANLALRFDLTVPMARYVAQYERELAFPFMRYAIGKVWRGERAQSGRFREFYQCDIDVVGNGSLSLDYDAQVPAIMYAIFTEIAIGDVLIRINNRKILQGFMEGLGISPEKHTAVLTLVDKLDKIGKVKVSEQAKDLLNIESSVVDELVSFLETKISLELIVHQLVAFSKNEMYQEGVQELSYVVNKMKEFGVSESSIIVDLSIARGLDYYTGTVYETSLQGYPQVGSICSGGRYDNLVANFSKKQFPGVGMSIGLTRLLSRLAEFDLVKQSEQSFAKVLLACMSLDFAQEMANLSTNLRKNGLACEQYFTPVKLEKQIMFALKKGYTFIVIFGKEESEKGVFIVKNLVTREQVEVPFGEVFKVLTK